MSDPFLDRMEAFDEVQTRRNITVQHEREVLAAQANVAAARAPELAAKALQASRATGVPAGAYDADYLKIFDTQRRQSAVEKVGVKYPKIATFLANPDNASVAQDDYDNLSRLGALWDGLRKDFAQGDGILEQAGDYITRRVYGLQAGFDRFTVASNTFFESLTPPAQRSAAANAAMRVQQPYYRQRAIRNEAIQALPIAGEVSWEAVKKRPSARNIAKFVGQQGAAAIPDMVTAISNIPLYVVGRSGEIGQDRARNNNQAEASMGDIAKGAPAAVISAYLERLGVEKILFPNAENVAARIAKSSATEGTTEFVQEGVENTGSTLGTDKGFDPAQILDQSIAAAVGGAGTGGAIRTGIETPHIVFKGAQKAVAATIGRNAAEKDATFLDKLATAAQDSKTRGRDPQAFESLVAALSADTGAENIYIPAEKVREYLQSNDWDSVEFWQEYDQEIADGTISNGDVVVPVAKAVAHLAGTPAWEALKGDMRLTPGGQSLNEAQETEASLSDEMNRLSDEVAAQLEADRAEAEPRQRLFDSALKKLHEAGQTLSEATKVATLVANRYATRAARLGREITGNEFDHVQVQQVLPAGLAPVLARDPGKPLSVALRPIVAAMRGKKAARSEKARSGPSLIDFIRSKGGIDDPGGDLEAIGFAKLKSVSKKGQTKLIRKTRGEVLASQGAGLLGSDGQVNSNSPDELAMRAWEAGYFPEFTERPSVNDLLDALAEGNSGRHRYVASNENVTDDDQLRMAAQDLYQLLDQAGLDPDTASDKDIATAIQRYQEQASRGFEPDSPEGTYTIADPISSDEPETVRVIVHRSGATAIVRDDGQVIEIDKMLEAGFSVERAIAQSLGVDTTGANVSREGTQPGRSFDQVDPKSEAFKAWFGDSKVVDENGEPLVVYHGTTADFESFDSGKANPESDLGAGVYFTNTPEDVSENYAGFGPDLTNKIEREAERIANERDLEYDDPAVQAEARAKFATHEGATIPVYLSIQNPVEIGGDNETYLDYQENFDEEIEEYDEPTGKIVDFIEALRGLEGSGDFFDMDAEAAASAIFEQLSGETEISAADLIDLLKTNEDAGLLYASDENGDLVSSEVIRRAFEAIGFDGFIDHTVDQKFGSQKRVGQKMAGMHEGTTHYVAFSPTQIKSVNNRGTFDPNDARILFQSAYHGSPHIFDKFSLDAIGSGEGAQAFGYGLYFAGRKEIAEFYRNTLTLNVGFDYGGKTGLNRAEVQNLVDMKYGGRYLDNVARASGVADKVMDDLIYGGKNNYKEGSERRAIYDEIAAELKRPENTGRLYHVDIPEDNEYLLWDAPLSEQPEKVKAALKTIEGGPMWQDAMQPMENSTGDALRRALQSDMGNTAFTKHLRETKPEIAALRNDSQKVSMLLHEAGIAGIKYLDGGSRADGDGSYNYVVFDDNAVSIRAYEQSYSDGPRGRVTFDNGMAVIDLFQQRDLSTFIHEMGHVWLEELQADASRPDAPQQLRDDWQAVQDWLAANGHAVVDGVIPVDGHELWARGIERYTMEGKAPSSALRKVFDAFRSWMLSIYQMADNLRAPITPEIRSVMDRLIATDQEIEDARAEQNLKALFDSVEAAAKFGMNEAAYNDYSKAATEAKDEAFDRLLFKTMEAVRRERTKAYQDERDAVEADVRASVDARPVFRALAAIRTKDGPKLDKQWLIDTYGEDVLASLPKSVPPIFKANGTDADIIAEASGFATGDEMVKALIGVEDRRAALREGGDKRSARDSIIDEETDAIMKERHGDPLSDGSIEEEALALIHNEKQGELQAIELRVLSSKTKAETRPTPYRIARLWAAEKIRTGQVKDVASRAAIQRYLRAASKAGKAAEQAYMAGDTDEAFKQKQAQMLNNALVAEAKQAADAIDVAVARMSRYAKRRTIKSMDQDYLERIHDLLERVDLKQRSQASIDRQGSFEAWRAEQEAKGHEIVTPESFLGTIGTTHWTRLSVENLLGLDETVKQIAHLGRYKQELIDNKAKREFDAVVDEFLGQASLLPPKPPADLVEPGFFDRIKSNVATSDAALLKIETLVDWFDGGNSDGVFNRIVFKPIADAQDRENEMTADYTRRIVDAMQKGGTKRLKRWAEKISIPELQGKFGPPTTREQLISAALNMGNEGNIQRLTDGYGWNEATLREVLDRELSAEDWQFVQDVWDIIDTLWPDVAAMERRINGVEPEKIQPVPVVTKYGTFKGGYYPAIYDSTLSVDAETHAGAATDLFSTLYQKATTRASSTKDRAAQVKRPILLKLGVINRHIGEVIHDITHREAIMQADKFLSSRRVIAAMDATLGPEYRKQFRPWLQFVANSWAMERAGNEGIGKWMTRLKSNTTVVGMGFRFTTILTQIAGYSNSFGYVGEKWMLDALAKTTAHPIATFNFVMERSGEVRNRMDTLDRDLRQGLAQLQGKSGLKEEVARFAFHGIGYMDRVVVIPTWIGAYNKALAAGMTETQAVYEGDKAVRKSQGSGSPKDLAAVQRGTGRYGFMLNLMTMFYTFLSSSYQQQRTLGRDASSTVRTKQYRNFPKLLARSFWIVVLPSVLPEILAGRGPGDDEDWTIWTIKNMLFTMLGPIPGVRDVARPIWDKVSGEKGFGYELSPIGKAGESLVNSAGDIARIAQGEETKRATRNILETTGYFTGLVPGQVAASVQFLVDVGNGDQTPETVSDWYTGLTKGKIDDN